MKQKEHRGRHILSRITACAALAALLVVCLPLAADDRALLRDAVGAPYVFILFDTSGSMHWTPKCSQENFDDGVCTNLCPTGDCFTNRNGDDPNAKFRQAKEAMYEVLQQVTNINFGFATYNQDDLRVTAKHWLYRVSEDQPNGLFTLDDGTIYPEAGSEDNFGDRWSCNSGGSRTGCDNRNNFADVDDTWEMHRTQRYPKLDPDNSYQYIYIRDTDGRRYRVVYRPLSQSAVAGQALGDPILDVKIKLGRCNSNSGRCGSSNSTTLFDYEIRYELVGDFLAWDIGTDRTEPKMGFFSQGTSDDGPANNTCAGWDPASTGNPSSDDDLYSDYRVRWPTDTSHPFVADYGWLFYRGDVLPLDWNDDNYDEVLKRFAPNHGTGSDPDFGIASYFEDVPRSGESIIRLKDEDQRPMLAWGSTPIGESIKDFREWYAGCSHGSCPHGGGWSDVAAEHDPDWGCRKRYLLVVTDGDNTCQGADACSGTAALHAQEDIKTYVVAFGVENSSGNRLNCMANNGGTGDPIYPQNKQELVDALSAIFGEIKEEARTFASAAVPSVQSEVADLIYLSNFTPLNGESLWDGHLDSYLKPLPLTDDGRPDKSRKCSATVQSACHLFDAGEVLLTQTPTAEEAELAAPGDFAALKLGDYDNQRRVFYGQENLYRKVPGKLWLFFPPDPNDGVDQLSLLDLGRGMNFPMTEPEALADKVNPIIRKVLAQKEAVIEDVDGNESTITFVLGDIFHSDPTVIDSPHNFGFFVQDLFVDDPTIACDDTSTINRGYRCFAEKHRWRRKMLAVGANDGQVHFFDGGYFDHDTTGPSKDPYTWRFTNGTGKEMFSYIPRLTLPILREQVEGSRQIYSVDGSVTVDDVFIDPTHKGVGSNNEPDPDDREWRTVAIGGLREGGSIDGGGHLTETEHGFVSGYYALDITQPDKYEEYSYDRDTNVGVTVTEKHYLGTKTIKPHCIRVRSDGGHKKNSGCKTLHGKRRSFPAELWLFTDTMLYGGVEYAMNEEVEDYDGDGVVDGRSENRDLGDTWSNPVITRIRTCTSNCDPDDADNDIESAFVAVFGGGFDPFSLKEDPQRGTFIYMVEVETGTTLYKRQVHGMVTASPSVISDQFGVASEIYFGTTAGLVYKIAIRDVPGRISTQAFDPLFFNPQPPNDIDVTRIFEEEWEPFPIFDTSDPLTGEIRPLYTDIVAFRIDEADSYGLAFGTGDREDLWAFDDDDTEGRYYFIVDEVDFTRLEYLDGNLPIDESSYQMMEPEISDFAIQDPEENFLFPDDAARSNGIRGGWAMKLADDERTLGKAFGLKGILIFTTYQPQSVSVDPGHGNPHDNEPVCSRTGVTRVFALFVDNGNPIGDERYASVPSFVGPTVVDPASTTNPGDSQYTDPNTSSLSADDRVQMEYLKRFFPDNCRFANYWLNVTGSRSDTGIVIYIKIPICSVEGRWRDF
ncbi:MAG: hypothetical protein GY856_54300 [bacterium]|nr:hypothetical protein [bacterium]